LSGSLACPGEQL